MLKDGGSNWAVIVAERAHGMLGQMDITMQMGNACISVLCPFYLVTEFWWTDSSRQSHSLFLYHFQFLNNGFKFKVQWDI